MQNFIICLTFAVKKRILYIFYKKYNINIFNLLLRQRDKSKKKKSKELKPHAHSYYYCCNYTKSDQQQTLLFVGAVMFTVIVSYLCPLYVTLSVIEHSLTKNTFSLRCLLRVIKLSNFFSSMHFLHIICDKLFF